MGQQLLFCRCCAHGYSDAVMQQPQGAGIPRDAAPAGAANSSGTLQQPWCAQRHSSVFTSCCISSPSAKLCSSTISLKSQEAM